MTYTVVHPKYGELVNGPRLFSSDDGTMYVAGEWSRYRIFACVPASDVMIEHV